MNTTINSAPLHKSSLHEVNIYLDEGDMYESRPMYEYILRYLMHEGIAGATMFRGAIGYGKRHHLHYPGKIGAVDDVPILITFVDKAEQCRKVTPHLKSILKEGLMYYREVEMM